MKLTASDHRIIDALRLMPMKISELALSLDIPRETVRYRCARLERLHVVTRAGADPQSRRKGSPGYVWHIA